MPFPHPLFSKPDSPDSSVSCKLVVVGQAPAHDGDGKSALTGRSLHVLFGKHDLRRVAIGCHRLNLIPIFPGRSQSRGDRFPVAVARAQSRRLLPNLDGRIVLSWGAAVADLLNPAWRRTGWLAPVYGRFTLFPFPHPSGLNRWWNDRDNSDAARARANELLDHAYNRVASRRGYCSRDMF